MSNSEQPNFTFKYYPSNYPYDIPSPIYLQNHPESKFGYIATGSVVFHNPASSDPRILLLQRSAHDSWPNRWEIPGGACDDEDASILHAAARELHEESGLEASFIGPLVGDVQIFTTSSGKRVGKFMFFIETRAQDGGPQVKLDSNEHQNFVWASEGEVKAKRTEDLKLEFTTPDAYDAILKAFELYRNGKPGMH